MVQEGKVGWKGLLPNNVTFLKIWGLKSLYLIKHTSKFLTKFVTKKYK